MTLPTMLEPATGETFQLIDADALQRAAGLPDLHDATALQLGTFAENCDHLISVAGEAKRRAGAEAIRQMDRRGTWTVRADGFELKSSSPAAGTSTINAGRLAEALEQLVDADRIDQAAADAALERPRITATVTGEDVDTIAHADLTSPEGRRAIALLLDRLHADLAEAEERAGGGTPKKAGINALRKMGPDVAEVIDACEDPVTPPERKATIKRLKPAKA